MANKMELSRTDENPKLFFCFPRGSQCISFVTFVQVTTSSMFDISENILLGTCHFYITFRPGV